MEIESSSMGVFLPLVAFSESINNDKRNSFY